MPGTVQLNRSPVAQGDTVIVSAQVKNAGSVVASGVEVGFFDGDPGIQFGSTSVTLSPGQITVVQAQWIAAAPDTHFIRVVVDPFGLSSESSYTNNSASRTVVLGQPVTAVQPSLHPGLWFSAPRPNPTIVGPTTFSFSLPSSQRATLEVFDVQGRRIRQWLWDTLSAGRHDVAWGGDDAQGTHIRGGMFFVRLKSESGVLSHRFVRVQ